MKKLLLGLCLSFFTFVNGQILYRSDYIETFDADWSGIWWTPIPTSNYFTNASVSPSASAVLYGSGTGTSGYESDWYSFPNLVVDPNKDYYFTFRLASYRFTSTNSTRGVDVGDYIVVQLSTDGGINYTNEIQVTGRSNAYWNYNTNAVYTKTANGILTTIGPAAGGNRTSTGDGYSSIRLDIPPNTSNIAIDIFARANSSGEEWWMDNFEIREVIALPVELTEFTGYKTNEYNVLKWQTASEHNSDYFLVERSTTGEFNENSVVTIKQAAGNSTELLDYTFVDKDFTNAINYYRLTQVDYDGNFKQYGPIAIDNRNNGIIIKYVNLLGQEVDDFASGVLFEVYEDGSIKRIWRP
jgi:hypothetical protein